MKICAYGIAEITPGKKNIKDPRLDQVDKFVKAKKKTYVQVDVVAEADALLSDAVLAAKSSLADLVLHDLDFVETRLSRNPGPEEKEMLDQFKAVLEKEQCINTLTLTEAQKAGMASYNTLTNRPVILIEAAELENPDELFARALREAGYISFFTAGEKETRAWLIKKGTPAVEAAGAIHSDIQKGFIRAEIISLEDYLACGGETGAKQANKMRLEGKEYVMQDCDLVNFRFNK